MAIKNIRFQIRLDDEFMVDIDHWRASQRPIPSRAETLRMLVYRGLAMEDYLAVILRHSASELADAGIIGGGAGQEIYERFQRLVVSSVDLAVKLKRFPEEAKGIALPSVLREIFEAPETRDQEKPERKTRSNSH